MGQTSFAPVIQHRQLASRAFTAISGACRRWDASFVPVDEISLIESLRNREEKTLRFIIRCSHFPSAVTAYRAAGVLLSNSFTDEELRCFLAGSKVIGDEGNALGAAAFIDFVRGLNASLGREYCDLTEDEKIAARALLRVTAAVWIHAPDSRPEAITDNGEGIRLSDNRLFHLALTRPERVEDILSIIRTSHAARFEDIARQLG